MPYARVSDLPKAQVASYAPHQRKAFLEAFNDSQKKYGNEETSFKVAHHAAKEARPPLLKRRK